MPADKRIRISEQHREELHALKDVGRSYDDVIGELIEVRQRANRQDFFDRIAANEERAPEGFTPVEDVDP